MIKMETRFQLQPKTEDSKYMSSGAVTLTNCLESWVKKGSEAYQGSVEECSS